MTTLAQLTADIESYTQNNDPVFLAQIPSFIKLAEKRIFTDVKLPHVRKTAAGATVIGSRAYTLPTDFISMQSLTITLPVTGEVVHLLPKSPDFISEMYPIPTAQAQPKYYGQNSGTTLVLGPTPVAAYTVGVNYSAYPVSITAALIPATTVTIGVSYTINFVGTTDYTLIGAAANTVGTVFTATAPGTGTGQVYPTATGGTSWLGDQFDQTLLYGCLVEAYVFMKGAKEVLDYYLNLMKIGMDEIKQATANIDASNYR